MARREDYKMKKTEKGGMLAPKDKIVQKGKISYKTRYEGLVAPKDKIVEHAKPNYKDSRYS